ncbi:MAG: cysteine synthase A [Alphaproteobacteria bacterium]|nr:cysteine synthase A [Alphaproteobacteria bacterium]
MRIHDDLCALIGNTPLVRLRRASERTGCTILGKCEFMNPGQSVKDRAALSIVRDAERRGALRPGGVIVEGTAGNTGIGLCVVGLACGYRCVIVVPSNQSQEKLDILRLLGADLRLAKPAPYKDPENYQHVSRHLAEDLAASEPNGAIWANQFDNLANRRAHYETTGPEIWAQTEGKVDAFVSAIGTGGTISGTGLALKERRKDVRVVLADPTGSGMLDWVKTGTPKAEGSSITEGIGQGRVTANCNGAPIDDAVRVTDAEALLVLFELAQHEGLLLGGSSGINVAGSIKTAEAMGPGHTIVTLLCDHGARYMSKMYNPVFLRERDLPVPPWLA